MSRPPVVAELSPDRPKRGRPTLRKDGIPLTPAERKRWQRAKNKGAFSDADVDRVISTPRKIGRPTLRKSGKPLTPAEQQRRFRMKKNGFDLKEGDLSDLLAKQNNACAICKRPFGTERQAHADHCHQTGRARELLCNGCNAGLGFFKDDPERLRQAIVYLTRHRETLPV